MSKNKKTFKEDIERAERNILIFGWLGIASSIGVIIHMLVKLQ